MISANKKVSIDLFFGTYLEHDELESWLDLNLSEQRRAAQFAKEEDQKAFTIVRSVLKQLLSKKLRIPIQEIDLAQNHHGKLNCPQAPSYHFSVAHTDAAFVLAFSKSGPIGVDIESIHRSFDMEKLMQLVFTDGERLNFQTIPTFEDKKRTFLQTWTQKEALTKCLGITLQEGMQAFEIVEIGGLPFARYMSDSSIKATLKSIEIHSYIVSVCSTSMSEVDLKLNNIDLHQSPSLLV